MGLVNWWYPALPWYRATGLASCSLRTERQVVLALPTSQLLHWLATEGLALACALMPSCALLPSGSGQWDPGVGAREGGYLFSCLCPAPMSVSESVAPVFQ